MNRGKRLSLSARVLSAASVFGFALVMGASLYAVSKPSLLFIAMASSVGCVGTALVVLILNRVLFGDLDRIVRHAERLRNAYDLQGRLRVSGSPDTIALAKAINGFSARVHSTVYDLLNVIRGSQEIAGLLSRSAESSTGAARSVSERMRHIAGSSVELSRALQEAEKRMTKIKTETRSIADRIEEQSAAVSQTSAAAEQMVANIGNITRVVNERNTLGSRVDSDRKETEGKFGEISESIRRIAGSIGVIEESIVVINDTAARSRLLSMNAAIEAAHVGEAGKGFSVVADELKALSESTRERSSAIASSLKAIMENFERASRLVEESNVILSGFTGTVRGFLEGFGEIGNGINEMNTGTSGIISAIGTLGTATREVSGASARINETVSAFEGDISSLGKLTEKNREHAALSEREAETISGEILPLAALGRRNSAMLDLMTQEISHIKILDLSAMKASDGQPLLFWTLEKKTAPPRPEGGPFPETDRRHWHEYEFAGWNVEKKPLPPSPMDGPEGKRVAYLFNTQHSDELTYSVALRRGAKKMADLRGIRLEMLFAEISAKKQAVDVKEVLRKRPDLVIIEPTEAQEAVGHVKAFSAAGIPVIVSLMAVAAEAYPYIICYTGPDDWGQTRVLSRSFADKMGKKGGYCVLQHVPGSGTDYGRTFGAITEITDYAPELTLLEKAYSGFEVGPADEQVTKWVKTYGRRLSGILVADDNYMLAGTVRALDRLGRGDIVLSSAGNCKNGMDLVKAGKVHCITYQSAEATSALPLAAAADYFEGLEVPPVKNLPIQLITRENVEDFYPPQF